MAPIEEGKKDRMGHLMLQTWTTLPRYFRVLSAGRGLDQQRAAENIEVVKSLADIISIFEWNFIVGGMKVCVPFSRSPTRG